MSPSIENKICYLLAERNKEAIELVFIHYGSLLLNVINFDLPKLAEDYVHRIGRTGRAGASG